MKEKYLPLYYFKLINSIQFFKNYNIYKFIRLHNIDDIISSIVVVVPNVGGQSDVREWLAVRGTRAGNKPRNTTKTIEPALADSRAYKNYDEICTRITISQYHGAEKVHLALPTTIKRKK